MDIKAGRVPGKSSVFDRVKVGGSSAKNGVCRYWMAGCCKRSDCRFLHPEVPAPGVKKSWKNPNYHVPKTNQISGVLRKQDSEFEVKSAKKPCNVSRVLRRQNSEFEVKSAKKPCNVQQSANPEFEVKSAKKPCNVPQSANPEFEVKSAKKPCNVPQSAQTSETKDVVKRQNKELKKQLCKYWVTGNCVYGDQCKNLHSWYHGDGFTMLAKLNGHTKAVTGIALPSGSDKLYSVSKDKSMRVWNCHTGQCGEVVNFDDECGSLMCEGPCIFVGLPNAIKAWNFECQAEVALNGPVVGQVYAMEVGSNMLFAGTQDGNILVWKSCSSEVAATLKGHTGAVVSLVVGANRLYSGSMDKTIKVWDLETLKCLRTLHGHSEVVMSVICWDKFLISGSLDGQIKVWAATESGNLEVVKECEGHGILRFCGITDAEAKPILLCSCNDNSVRLYELPSFIERGRIYANGEVRTLQIGTGGLFFTGDAMGQLTVWKLDEKSSL